MKAFLRSGSFAIIALLIASVLAVFAPSKAEALTPAQPAQLQPASFQPLPFQPFLTQPVPAQIDLNADTELILTKLEQPATINGPADGLPLTQNDLQNYTPISDVTFKAEKVALDNPLNTLSGWQQAALMSIAEAKTRTSSTSTLETTDLNGEAVFDSLGVGLFLITEVSAPAGVIPSAPFLVVLPMNEPESSNQNSNPNNGAGWLYSVHVYPKNATVAISLAVNDQNAYARNAAPNIANTVYWQATSTLPRSDEISAYEVSFDIPNTLKHLGSTSGIDIAISQQTTAPGLIAPGFSVSGLAPGFAASSTLSAADYTVTAPAGAGGRISVVFTPTGLAKLAAAKLADDAAAVTVGFSTQVLADGDLRVDAHLCAHTVCLGETNPQKLVNDSAMTKWGPLGIEVFEEGNQSNKIPGAKFMIFLNEADAKQQKNPISVDGVSEWVSDANGHVVIHGLRLSNYVNGQTRFVDDPLFRHYWVVLVEVPKEWVGSTKPIKLQINSTLETQMQLALFELHQSTKTPDPDGKDPEGKDPDGGDKDSDAKDSGSSDGSAQGPSDGTGESGLKQTGAQIVTTLVAAGILVGVGAALFIIRRRKNDEEET